jgi:hypothetical protein
LLQGRIPVDLEQRIRDFGDRRDLSRSEAVRLLLEAGLGGPRQHAEPTPSSSAVEPSSQPTFRELLVRFYAEDPARIAEFGLPEGASPEEAARDDIQARQSSTTMLFRFEQLLEELTIGEYSGPAADALKRLLWTIVG